VTEVGETFNCEICRQPTLMTNSEEEAVKTAEATFGPIPHEERAAVCEDCYAKFLEWWMSKGPGRPQ
jgi:hypothetical protein